VDIDDFLPIINGFLTFTDQITRQCTSISIVMDNIVESTEMFSISLIPISPNVVVGVPLASDVIILDSDGE